jgi:hypothetical protein
MVFKTVFVVAKSIPTQILAQNKWYPLAGKINIQVVDGWFSSNFYFYRIHCLVTYVYNTQVY